MFPKGCVAMLIEKRVPYVWNLTALYNDLLSLDGVDGTFEYFEDEFIVWHREHQSVHIFPEHIEIFHNDRHGASTHFHPDDDEEVIDYVKKECGIFKEFTTHRFSVASRILRRLLVFASVSIFTSEIIMLLFAVFSVDLLADIFLISTFFFVAADILLFLLLVIAALCRRYICIDDRKITLKHYSAEPESVKKGSHVTLHFENISEIEKFSQGKKEFLAISSDNRQYIASLEGYSPEDLSDIMERFSAVGFNINL